MMETGAMSRKSLEEFASTRGQTNAANLLGMSQGSLNKALQVGRDVFVTEHADGSFSAEELRPFPVQSAKRTRRRMLPI
jgi:hypothetical protein